ncbi:hypothetical protein S40293_07268 [Stachybotrys chartarum IBT 40293]|nr:hypothetical protein S40293_07268 [Stachybotrys chartarum IBT 40293]
MAASFDVDAAAKQLDEFRSRNDLAEILEQYSSLIVKFKRLSSDYEEEREGRERYKQLARGQERKPFVLVLVDGDGYVFQDTFVRDGADGGSKAAKQLITSIRSSLGPKGLDNCDIMVRVYANLVGLSKILSKNGLIGPEKRSLAPFTAGFNRSHGLTDFVDAGELKENADFKLRAMLQLYADNLQCKHIYFAGCHDVGYVADLTPYRGNSDRFTLIRSMSSDFHAEFTRLGFNIEEFPGVFRSSPLAYPEHGKPSLSSTSNKASATSAGYTTSNMALPGNSRSICQFYSSARCKYGDNCRNAHIDSKTKLSRLSPDGSLERDRRPFGLDNDALGWRLPGQKSSAVESKNDSRLLPKSYDIPAGLIAINRHKHRLDAYIVHPTTDAIKQLKARAEKRKLCNKKHIGGYCPNEDDCAYDHDPLPDDLLPALELLSRSIPCPRRGSCRKRDCVFGHVCQKMSCRHRGGSAPCKFPYSMCHEEFTPYDYVPGATLSFIDDTGQEYYEDSVDAAEEMGDEDQGAGVYTR